MDIKEKLYIHTLVAHGVNLRSGRHVPRSDKDDFDMLVKNLAELEVHVKKEGRSFGHYELPANVMEDKRFDKSRFYRWINSKIKENKRLSNIKDRAA